MKQKYQNFGKQTFHLGEDVRAPLFITLSRTIFLQQKDRKEERKGQKDG
jgi:hypothetical protein